MSIMTRSHLASIRRWSIAIRSNDDTLGDKKLDEYEKVRRCVVELRRYLNVDAPRQKQRQQIASNAPASNDDEDDNEYESARHPPLDSTRKLHHHHHNVNERQRSVVS